MKTRWLGRVSYLEAWDLQRALSRRSDEDYLLLLEHPPIYTLGTNGDDAHVLVDPVSVGAELVRVDRGGDVTYHGPGQLIGYPLISVGPGLHRGPAHVRSVEGVVIEALVALGLNRDSIGRLDGYPGVWVGLDQVDGDGPRKICAIGVRTARGRTMHGFALNVDTDLSMFDHIVPCGIDDKSVTSLAAEGCRASMAEVVDAIITSASSVWGPANDIQRVTDGHAHRRAPVPVSAPLPVSAPVPVSVGPTKVGVGVGSVGARLRRAGLDPQAGVPLNARKPPWLRIKARMGDDYLGLKQDLHDLNLVTVCEEAGCPNIYECWSGGTATFMINGSRCTRSCGFCQVDTRRPLPLDPGEPDRVAEAVERMGLSHAVVTCVARDDLPDGGAEGFAATIAAIRDRSAGTAVEVLISDCKGDLESLQTIFDAHPDILNHNIETVARLQRVVRPSAGYARSLAVLARAKDADLTTKSGIILGMGEQMDEVLATLADLRAVGTDIVTIGQYLRPTADHLPVDRWWTPEEFEQLRVAGMAMGFSHVQSSPLTRSSYHAREAAEASA
jgi:lipoic acid synthetase